MCMEPASELSVMFVKNGDLQTFLIHTVLEFQKVITEFENYCIKCGSSHCKVYKTTIQWVIIKRETCVQEEGISSLSR